MKTRHGEREPQKRFLPAQRFRRSFDESCHFCFPHSECLCLKLTEWWQERESKNSFPTSAKTMRATSAGLSGGRFSRITASCKTKPCSRFSRSEERRVG